MPHAAPRRSRRTKAWPGLEAPGWMPQTRNALERLIRRGAGKHLPVVFDFDNTIVCGDIGEATLAILVRSGVVTPARVPATLCPPFRVPGGRRVTLESCADLTEYYEAFLALTAHGNADPTPLANGYVWAVEVMEGLRPLDVVRATKTAFAVSEPGQRRLIEVTPGRTAYPAPFFYPEMVELLAGLLRHRFDVWIISASNVWSVRWMVLHALNPQLLACGLRAGVRADHVVGVSTLLADRRGHLYKDAVLVRDDAAYAALEGEALSAYRLTSRLEFPAPTYSGKVARVWDLIGQRPHLCAGDSPGDHAMMAFSQHRLWIARLEKSAYQQATEKLIRRTGQAGWIVQPTRTGDAPGFLGNAAPVAWRDPFTAAAIPQGSPALAPAVPRPKVTRLCRPMNWTRGGIGDLRATCPGWED